jgi:hypothetical protein
MKVLFKLLLWLVVLVFFSPDFLGIIGIENTACAFEIDADKVLWNRLSYRAKSIFGKVSTDVHLLAVPVEETADLLINDPAGEALQPAGKTIYTLTVNTNIIPLFGPDEILKTKSWFDPNGAGALQRVRLRQGQDKWQKSYRFTKKGVFRLKKRPKDSSEENLPLDQWTRIKNRFFLYGDKGRGCSRILEPASLLHIVSTINETTAQDPLDLCVFNKKQLHLVKVSLGGSQSLKVDYLEKLGDSQIRVDKKIDTIKISFQPRSLAPTGIEPEVFSFLGLKGDFDIFIDQATNLPVQVSGETSVFGKVDIRLYEVELKTENRRCP